MATDQRASKATQYGLRALSPAVWLRDKLPVVTLVVRLGPPLTTSQPSRVG